MPVSLNPALNPLTTQRAEALQGPSALKSNQAVKAVAEQAPEAQPAEDLQLKGLDKLESLAWLQVTDASLSSAQTKLTSAQQQLPDNPAAADQALDDFAELTEQAYFRGQAVFTTESPALETLTHLSENPPYFMTSAGEAVDLFRQQMAEQLEADLQEASKGVPLGETLAEDLRNELASILDQAPQQAGESITAEFSAQGLDFTLQGQTSVDAQQQVFLTDESLVTTVVNGNELVLQGPFIRLVGPVSDDEFALPEDEQAQPQVAIDLQQKIYQLAESQERASLDTPDLQAAIEEAIQLFDEVRQRLQSNMQAISEGSETSSTEEGFEAVQAAQQKAAEVFAQEPRAALQTQANATPDLVLNTLAE